MVGPAAKRAAVAHLQAVMSLSERRACSIVGADRKMIRYRSSRPPDATLRGRLRDLANERRRFGYRRLFVLLRREGEPSGINRIYRLYREEGLTVRKRRARRKAVGTRAPILVEAMPNARWSLDFVHDQFANGRRFRILNIVDDVTKECLGAIPDTSISGRRVARELTAAVERRGKPGMIVSDHGTEFTCNAMLAWCRDAAIDWHFIAPGKPMQNGFVESFNGRMRDELLNETLFFDLDDARAKIANWVADYNLQRPHSSLKYSDPRGLCRPPHRNGRSATQPRPAPPIVRCSNRATWRTKPRGSNRGRMKVRWQVTSSPLPNRLRFQVPLNTPQKPYFANSAPIEIHLALRVAKLNLLNYLILGRCSGPKRIRKISSRMTVAPEDPIAGRTHRRIFRTRVLN
ncbi:hypothetical protein CI1B_74250 [Bradyrhizobium ivorense]|uniref:Integrase catalytic domain-containing protein n=2 Tax=Bradyrhizobium ivorense TaxID=2511166 RepID=A0A508TWV2_9BRAD|nr:hypothetical protein CI1B_74250 [Bradyrhizobium ivorense]